MAIQLHHKDTKDTKQSQRVFVTSSCSLCLRGEAGFERADARRMGLAMTRVLVFLAVALVFVFGAQAEEKKVTTVGVWEAPAGLKQIPLWPGVVPDMKGNTQPPESVLTAETPEAIGSKTSQAVFDVTVPTLTVFPAKGKNTGVTMIVFPGGGFRAVVLTLEGTEICDWLTAKGITCVLVKYRVPGGNHWWNPACKCHETPKVPRALQDAQRSIRLVRSMAKELGVDPAKIGVIGFSAGGYLVAQTSNIFKPSYKPVDEIDKVSSRPDFAVALYPGHICRDGGKFDPTLPISKDAPPTFLLQAWDDPVDEICNSTMYARALDQAGVATEVHLFANGGHAFALRKNPHPVAMWPTLVENWMRDVNILSAK